MFPVELRSWALILLAMSLCAAFLSGERKRESTGDKKRFLHEVDRLENPSEKKAELEAYIARNAEGPHLSFAYGLLLDLLRTQQPQAALRLADKILTGQEPEAGLHFYPYLTKFAVYGDLRDQNSAVALARRILVFESDPELLRLASRHDPEKAEEYEAGIQSALLKSQKTEFITFQAELFQLGLGEWESVSDEDKVRHLTQLIRSHEALPESDPAVIKRFPSLYYEIALVLARVCVKSRKTGRPTPICCGVVLVRPLHMDALRSFHTVWPVWETGNRPFPTLSERNQGRDSNFPCTGFVGRSTQAWKNPYSL